MSLKDFRPDPGDLAGKEEAPVEDSLQPDHYHQEINTIKIEKLSNRVTIISIIIPCLIIAVLVFAYMDIQEKVVDVDVTQKSQVEAMVKKTEEKLNALDVRIAKDRFDLEKGLEALSKKEQALENQVAKMAAEKADAKSLKTSLADLGKKIAANEASVKNTAKELKGVDKRFKTSLADAQKSLEAQLNKQMIQMDDRAVEIKEEITLFREEIDTRLALLSAYEEQIGQLRKTTSLIDKKVNGISSDIKTRDKAFNTQLEKTRLAMEKNILDLEARVKQLVAASKARPSSKPEKPSVTPSAPKAAPSKAPVPQLDTDTSVPGGITQENLSQ